MTIPCTQKILVLRVIQNLTACDNFDQHNTPENVKIFLLTFNPTLGK